jgi:hypothetical protein
MSAALSSAAALARKIQRELAAVLTCEKSVATMNRRAVQHATEAGRLLIRAKAAVGHGQWMTWCAKHVGASTSTVTSYMALANFVDSSPANCQRIGNLATLSAALAVVREAREPAGTTTRVFVNCRPCPAPVPPPRVYALVSTPEPHHQTVSVVEDDVVVEEDSPAALSAVRADMHALGLGEEARAAAILHELQTLLPQDLRDPTRFGEALIREAHRFAQPRLVH